MAEEWEIGRAYIQFESRGDTTPEIEKQQARADQANRRQMASLRDMQREKLRMMRDPKFGGVYAESVPQRQEKFQQRVESAAQQGLSVQKKQQARREADDLKDIERMHARMKQIRRRQATQVESFHKAEERAARDLHDESRRSDLRKRAQLLAAGALTKTAFGSVPFVGGAADIAMAGAVGGPVGAGAMAVGKGLQYGIEGAGKASPATMERLNYQLNRLQAGFGQQMLPQIQKFTRGLEKASDWLFGKGAQLASPQIGHGPDAFAALRDRLQVEALREMPKDTGSRASKFSEAFDKGGWTGAIGNMISKDLGDAIGKLDEQIESTWVGRRAKDIVNPEHAFRSLMSVFD